MSIQVQQSHNHISSYVERLETDVESYQQRLDYLRTKRDRVAEEVDQLMDSLQDVLKQKKDELLEKLNELYSCEKQKLQIDIRDKQAIVSETKSGLSKMREFMLSRSEDDAEELGRLLEEKSTKCEISYDEEKPRLVDLNLNINFGELMNAASRLPFGDVDAVYDDRGFTVMKRFLSEPSTSICSTDCGEEPFTGRAVHTNTIHTRVEGDKTEPKLNDIAVVEVDDVVAIVVTDRSNKCIKSFYKRKDLAFYSLESASTQPRGIARVGSGKVGVTFPEARSIKFLKVTPALRRDKEIKTAKRYRGIGMLDLEKLVVSTYETYPGTVDILDYKGNLLSCIRTDRNGDNLFDYPFYICTTLQRSIIVSDCERKTVTCISEAGNIIFRYGLGGEVTVKYPLGVALDTFGDILVVDCDNHKVVKILADGQGAKEFLGKEDGITGPYSVDVDAYGAIYVAQWNGDIKEFNID